MDYAKALPVSGTLIRLTTVPVGSYATAGHVYRVTYNGTLRTDRTTGKRVKVVHAQTTVDLRDEQRDCGTIDNAFMWNVAGRMAAWEVIAERVAK